jgi:large repetitive protein
MKSFIKILLFILLILSNIKFSSATHVSGGELVYNCIGPNQYQITLNLYYDCSATISMPTNLTIQIANDCGYPNTSISLPLQNPGGDEVSQLCPAQAGNSTCNGGSLPGMQHYIYTGVVTLNPPCDSYRLSYRLCCRNTANNLTNSQSDNFYVEAILNTATNNCNDSPEFTSQPIPYVCVNQPVNYNYGVLESNGDSLVFELVSAKDNTNNLVNYAGGYSAGAPFPGITVNPQNGQISFTPTTIGKFVVVMRVSEYDANGNFLGSVLRDIQFVVQNCTNQVPDPNGGQISNLNGSATQLNPYSISVCESFGFSFDLTFTDPNPADILTYTSNITSSLPGATITSSGFNPLTLTVSWTATPGTAGMNTSFTITISDNACPIAGLQSINYYVNVQPRTNTIPDANICLGNNITLTTTGGTLFNWSVLSGDSIIIGTNFSCNPCQNPVVNPTNNTTYVVNSDLIGCFNTDTVTISVINPDATIITPSQTICLDVPNLQLVAQNPIGIWLGPGVNQITGLFTPATAGVGTHTIRHRINSNGCFDEQNIQITVSSFTVNITPLDPTVCPNANTVLTASGATTYVWDASPFLSSTNGTPVSANPDTTTTFKVTGTNAAGCKSEATTTLTVYPSLEIQVSNSQVLCKGQTSDTLTVIADGGDGSYQYSWSPILGLNNAIGSQVVATPDTTTNYVVTVTDGCDLMQIDTILIEVNNLPVIEFTTDTTVGCMPVEIAFNVITQGLVSYSWNFDDGNSSPDPNPTNSFNEVGKYDVVLTATDTNGCENFSEITTIEAFRNPIADFYSSPNPTTIFNSFVNFIDNSSTDVTNWFWDLDSLFSDTSQNTNFFFSDTGIYDITLVVRTKNMCYDTITYPLTILNDFVLYMPNSFTPNNDGLNDVFKPEGLQLDSYQFNMQIYDRWGSLVFETSDPNEGWNGSHQNTKEKLRKGLYVWVVYIGKNSANLRYDGHVNLLK